MLVDATVNRSAEMVGGCSVLRRSIILFSCVSFKICVAACLAVVKLFALPKRLL